MFGFGGGEILLIVFVILMLFGSDKVPEMARTMGKLMAQVKNATNDIKNEIQKGAESNGLDAKSISNFTSGITSEITETKNSILESTTSTTKELENNSLNVLKETTEEFNKVAEDFENSLGAIKRKK
jgi:sec-independent protein translocase protein TatA